MTQQQQKPQLLQQQQPQSQQMEFKLYAKRFFVVILFAFSQLMISVVLNTLNPIAAYLTKIYDEDPIYINLGGLLFVLMHPIFTFPASYVIDTYGTRVGIAIGCALGIVGVSLRMLINYGFAWVIVGQVIAGIGRPFILNCQAKISVNWFSAKTRGGITQLLTLILNVSLVIGILIPGLFFKGYDPVPENYQQGREKAFNLMFFQGMMALVCFIPNLFLQKSKPPTPPSESGTIPRDPFNKAIPKMLKNKNFLLLLVGFGCYFGIFNAMTIVLSYLISPWFSGPDQNLPLAVAAVGGSPVISGILGVIILGPIQRKSGVFKKWILICMTGSLIAIILFYPLLETNSLICASLISAINSFFLIPLVPIMLELGCELVFPVGEGSAVGMLFAMGNFSGFLLGLFMSMIVKGESKGQTLGGLGFCLGMFVIGIACVLMMKQVKNREIAESQSSQRRKSASLTRDNISEISDDKSDNLKQSLLDSQDANSPRAKKLDAQLTTKYRQNREEDSEDVDYNPLA